MVQAGAHPVYAAFLQHVHRKPAPIAQYGPMFFRNTESSMLLPLRRLDRIRIAMVERCGS